VIPVRLSHRDERASTDHPQRAATVPAPAVSDEAYAFEWSRSFATQSHFQQEATKMSLD
jgi:hypothetical protein